MYRAYRFPSETDRDDVRNAVDAVVHFILVFTKSLADALVDIDNRVKAVERALNNAGIGDYRNLR